MDLLTPPAVDTTTTTSGSSTTSPTAMNFKAMRGLTDAQIEQLQAQQGVTAATPLTADDVDAQLRDDANDQALQARNASLGEPPIAAQPDPFDPAGAPDVAGALATAKDLDTPEQLPGKTAAETFAARPAAGQPKFESLAGPRNDIEAKDEAERYAALQKEKLAREVEARQAELQKQLSAAIAQRAQMLAQASHPSSLWEDKSTAQKVLIALGMMGDRGLELWKHESQLDFERKKLKLENAIKLGQLPEQAYQQGMAELLAHQKAQTDVIDTSAQRMLAPFPAAQKAAAQAAAEMRAKQAKEMFDAVKQISSQTSTSGSATTQKIGGKTATFNPQSIDALTNAEEAAKDAGRIKELVAAGHTPTQDQLRELADYQNSIELQQQQDKESTAQRAKNEGLRAVGLIPSAEFPSSWSDEQRELFNLHNKMEHSEVVRRLGSKVLSGPMAKTVLDPTVAGFSDTDAMAKKKILAGADRAQRAYENLKKSSTPPEATAIPPTVRDIAAKAQQVVLHPRLHSKAEVDAAKAVIRKISGGVVNERR